MAISKCIVTPTHTLEKQNTRSLVELRAQVRARLLLSVSHIRMMIAMEDAR